MQGPPSDHLACFWPFWRTHTRYTCTSSAPRSVSLSLPFTPACLLSLSIFLGKQRM
ncbi:MAG: hypothetical protein BYD32DRAFT_416550 [Podila humilis]|nr:MAG: hypothetical protein BYD32DRAFT_416550 [Podila humilis]